MHWRLYLLFTSACLISAQPVEELQLLTCYLTVRSKRLVSKKPMREIVYTKDGQKAVLYIEFTESVPYCDMCHYLDMRF